MRLRELLSGLLTTVTLVLFAGVAAEAVDLGPRSEPSAPAESHGVYGSIAYDKTDCSWGRSWNYPTQSGADDRATSECSAGGGKHCQVLTQVGPNQCGAIAATTQSCSGYGWAVRPTKEAAEQEAINQCKSYNSNATCEVKVSVCSSSE
jgi:uncharacterized protein DUF4189